MTELWELSAVEQRRLLAARSVSARELVEAHLARIEAVNPIVNAVVALDPQIAHERAQAIDDAVAAGAGVGPLAGLVTAHKDLTETADFPTTHGSPVLAGFRPPADSVLVARMRAAGAVAIGKTNTPEFGAGSHTFNPVLDPPSRPLRVAWSRDLGGAPIEAGQVAVLDAFRASIEDLGWDVADDEPDLHGADECFATLRAWHFATGPTGKLGDRLPGVKATVQDEVRRGQALTPQQIADAYVRLGALWRRAADFFGSYDLLAAPVTQLAPFPIDWEYPTEIEGTAMDSYTAWMAVCCRVTVLGVPALSLPAGFDDDGLPVGIQLVGRHGADVELLRAAAVLEAATGHGRRRPGGLS